MRSQQSNRTSAKSDRLTPEQVLAFRSWDQDPFSFLESAVKIIDPMGNVVPFELRGYQRDCLERFIANRQCVVLKARQIGLTTCACGLALHLLLFRENRFILVLSKSDGDAKKFMRRIKGMYNRLPEWVKALSPQLVGKWGTQQAEFTNGSVIFSATSASSHGRGDTPTDVFLDEVGKMRNQEDSWTALVPALSGGGSFRIFGTAEGYRNWFHKKWLQWEKEHDVDTIFYGWRVVDGRDDEWAAKMRRELGDSKFRQEFPETAEEAFITSGSTVFSMELLESLEPLTGVRSTISRTDNGMLTLVREPTQDDLFGFFVYQPPEDGAKYVVSCDPSEGLVDGDPSVAQVLRFAANDIEQVAVLRGRHDPEKFAELCHYIAIFYNRALVVVERNNHGMTVLKRMFRLRTPNVVSTSGKPGIWTSSQSKASAISDTRSMLADGRLQIVDGPTIEELMEFQESINEKTGFISYAGSNHDDHVDALCLGASYALRSSPIHQEQPPPEEPDETPMFSLDWFLSGSRSGSRLI